MFKKIMSVMLAVVMLMSIAMIATSAAQVEIADNSADAIAEVAADGPADTGAEAGADTGAGNTLSFEANTVGWNNYKKVFCYLWVYGGESFFPWQAKASACTDTDGDGIWTYDLDAKGVTLEPGVLYGCIFSNENQMQTYDLLLDSTVIGDTAYCDGTEYENPKDSTKTGTAAFWRGQDPTVFGPVKCITSIGNVVGTCIPSTTSPQAMFETFLKENLENARTFSNKDDQTLLDDTAKALDLKQDDIEKAIANTGVSVEWKKAASAVEEGSNPDADKTPSGESTDKDNNSGDSGNSGTTSTTGGSGSTKTGSGSTTKTGQEITVLFIMLGVMLAAGAVVVISRKRDRA